MDWQNLIKELRSSMYPENRYLQNKICVRLDALSKNKNKEVAKAASELLDKANMLDEPFNFDKKLVRPENISSLYDVYEDTITLIENKLL